MESSAIYSAGEERGIRMETQRRRLIRRGGLFAKYVVSFVGLVVFVLAVNGALETWFMYRETKTQLLTTETEKAEAAARRVEQYMAAIERQLSWVTRASSTSIDQRRADYATLLQEVPEIDELQQLDGGGHEALRASRANVTVGTAADYSRDPRFEETLRRGVWWSPAYFRGATPLIMIGMTHSGRNAGVTVAEVNLKFLPDFVNASQVGKLVSAYLVGPEGRLLAASDPARTPGADLAKLPHVAALVHGNAPVAIGEDLGGQSVLTAAVPIPNLNWFVLVEQPLRQALAPIYDMLERIGALLLMGLILSITAGTVLARRMVIPIRKLQAGARELGENEFGHRIDVRTGDEVEDLARQFNRMAGQLQESYSRLEQKVEERTRDLVQSLHELKGLEELGRAINSSLDLDAVLTTIVSRAVEVTKADAGAIYSYHGALGVFELAKSVGLETSALNHATSVPAGESASVIGAAASKREPISIPDVANAADLPLNNVLLAATCNSMLIVPLAGQKEVLGALVIGRKTAGAFPSNTIGLMQTVAHQSVLAIENARLFRQVDQKSRELAAAHATVQQQAAKLTEQTEQLLSWNRLLEQRVATQLTELERVGRLQRFLAPQVAKLIASSDENASLLASHRREVTVVFCDLRGFTALTESAEPEEVMKILREYHATLGEHIFRYEGTLERFAGDGILILFNDPIPFPDHPQRAVHMAVEMRDSVGALVEAWRNRGHVLGFGIGIALGYATLGQVGFEGRLEYAAVGSVTNLASRLCSEAKAGQILISQRVYGLVGPWIDAAPVGALNLKGFSRPIPAFDVLHWRGEPQLPATAAK